MSHPRQTRPSPQAWPPRARAWPKASGAGLADAAAGSPSAHSSMTTRELQEYWRGEKGVWKPVRLLFEIASARIEEGTLSRFVVSTASSLPGVRGQGSGARGQGSGARSPGLGFPAWKGSPTFTRGSAGRMLGNRVKEQAGTPGTVRGAVGGGDL